MEALLAERLDLICILSPNTTHSPLAQAALRAGHHVLVEHPLATTSDDGRAVLRAAADCDRRIFVMRQRRYLKSVQILNALVAAKQFGAVRKASMRLAWNRRPEYFQERPWRAESQNGGVVLNQASHFFDILIYLFGEPITVDGAVGNLLHKIDVEDTAYGSIVFEHDVVVDFAVTTAAPEGHNSAELLIIFDGRRVALGGNHWEQLVGLTETEMAEATGRLQGPLAGDHAGYLRRVEANLQDEPAEVVEGLDGLRVVCLIDSIYTKCRRENAAVSGLLDSTFRSLLS